MYLGIDFGTCYSTLAIYTDDGKRAGLLPSLCGPKGHPTLMRYGGPQVGWYFGGECDMVRYPNDTVKNIKVLIRKGGDIDETVRTGGHNMSYRELLKSYLGWLIKRTVRVAKESGSIDEDEQVQGVTVTVPCGFTSKGMSRSQYGQAVQEGVIAAYREVIKSGVRLAGVGDPPVTIIEEPVAAAVEYLRSRAGRAALTAKSEMRILVADLGGGTFDVTVMKCKGYDSFKVITKDGDLELGGNDWDDVLLKELISKIKNEYPSFSLSSTQRIQDLAIANTCKEQLSEREGQHFNSCTGKSTMITRREFEAATKGLLERVKTIVNNCVVKSGGISTIDKIILVGGSCRMPQIKKGIKELYPRYNDSDILLFEPSYSIANGAAHCAALKTVKVIDDVATCTYGFRYTDSTKNIPYIQNMIFVDEEYAGDKIERKVETNFYPPHPDSKNVGFVVFESMYDKAHRAVPYDDNRDKFNEKGLSVTVDVPAEYYNSNRAKEYKMEPKMTLTSDGILILEIYHDGKVVADNKLKLFK